MRKAIVELEDHQVRALLDYCSSDNPTDEELGHALMDFLDGFGNVMDELGKYYDENND